MDIFKELSIRIACLFSMCLTGAVASAVEVKQVNLRIAYVDQVSGLDAQSQSGGSAAPFASISYALHVLALFDTPKPWTIKVKAGTYSAATGESFPIELHTGMVLEGVDGVANVIITGASNPNTTGPLVFGNGATSVGLSGITFRDQIREGGSQQGGALELLNFGGSISDCRFENNKNAPKGGAIYLSLASGARCDFTNVRFDGNVSRSSSWNDHLGGAIYVEGDFQGSMVNCTFLNNVAYATTSYSGYLSYGGAIFVNGNAAFDSFRSNQFDANQAIAQGDIAHGGAMCIDRNLTATLLECKFSSNAAVGAGYGGGVYVGGAFNGALNGSTFRMNTAGWQGGGIYVVGAAGLSIEGNTFEGNRASSSSTIRHEGGALRVGGNFEGAISGNTFLENVANADTSYSDFHAFGGAVYVGGTFTSMPFSANEFDKNGAYALGDIGYGGAVYAGGNITTEISGCDFRNNVADDASGYGGAIYGGGNFTGSIQSSVFSDNFAGWRGGAIYIGMNGTLDLEQCSFVENRTESSFNVQHQGGGVFVGGNFSGRVSENDFLSNQVRARTSYSGYHGYGAGMYVGGNLTSTEFVDNQFVGNQIAAQGDYGYGGGLYVLGDLRATIEASTFSANVADDVLGLGGAIYVGGVMDGGVAASKFQDNFAGCVGGAIYCKGSWTGVLSGSDFLRNAIKSHASNGFTAAIGGAVAVGGAYDGELSHNLVSDNQVITSGGTRSVGGAMAFLSAFNAQVNDNVFTNNRTANTSSSVGGAIAVFGKVERDTRIWSNTFSRNHGYGGGGVLYFGFEGDLPPKIYNNHFLYNTTVNSDVAGASILTFQNVNVYNNTLWGGGPDLCAIRLRDTASGSLIQNNQFGHIGTAINIRGEKSVRISHNNFFDTENILILNEVPLGNAPGAISPTVGNSSFVSNTVVNPDIYGEGHESANLLRFSGDWDENTYYDETHDRTVFVDRQGTWAVDELKGSFVNISKAQDKRDQYRISGNTQNEVYVAGNLVPAYAGIAVVNRGLLGEIFTIDNYRLTARSRSIDSGTSVITDRDEDITPDKDFEGDRRPLNCGIDIGADESLRPVAVSVTLAGRADLCLAVGDRYVEEGATALDARGVSIGELVFVEGVVNTALEGVYVLSYQVDLCASASTVRATRTVRVGSCEDAPLLADAGPDQTVESGVNGFVAVQLDGSASQVAEGRILAYEWHEVGGNHNPADVVRPTVMLSEGRYTFELNIRDEGGNVASDDVVIVVTGTEKIGLTAEAGIDQSVALGDRSMVDVVLDGSGSAAGEGTIVSYVWHGVYGAVDPDDVVSPTVRLGRGQYTFELVVTDDDGNMDRDAVRVSVLDRSDSLPVAVASSEVVQVLEAATRLPRIALIGSASTDADGRIVSYAWVGEEASPDPEDVEVAELSLAPGNYSFALAVTDNDGLVGSTTMDVIVARPGLEEYRRVISEEFATVDENGDRELSERELLAFIPYLLDEELQALDVSGNGVVSEDELLSIEIVLGCAGGAGPVGSRGLSDVLVVLLVMVLLGGWNVRSRSHRTGYRGDTH